MAMCGSGLHLEKPALLLSIVTSATKAKAMSTQETCEHTDAASTIRLILEKGWSLGRPMVSAHPELEGTFRELDRRIPKHLVTARRIEQHDLTVPAADLMELSQDLKIIRQALEARQAAAKALGAPLVEIGTHFGNLSVEEVGSRTQTSEIRARRLLTETAETFEQALAVIVNLAVDVETVQTRRDRRSDHGLADLFGAGGLNIKVDGGDGSGELAAFIAQALGARLV